MLRKKKMCQICLSHPSR